MSVEVRRTQALGWVEIGSFLKTNGVNTKLFATPASLKLGADDSPATRLSFNGQSHNPKILPEGILVVYQPAHHLDVRIFGICPAMPMLEVACFNPTSAITASRAGANRIELCENAEVGGTTPAFERFLEIRSNIAIPIFIMIRPRGGNFTYSEQEFEEMKRSLLEFKNLADGFVFGILNDERKVDIKRNSELVALAHPRPCTFHRAFDQTVNLFEALESVVECGMSTILTSGGDLTAIQACDMLAKLVQRAKGQIGIMPGGGVRSSNIQELISKTRAWCYHSSALLGDQQAADFEEIRKLKQYMSLQHDQT